jgi:putative salt-induced outer membrane protein YdiY
MLSTILLLQAAFPQPTLSPVVPEGLEGPAPVVQESEDGGIWTREADVGITKIEGNTETTNAAANLIYGWEGDRNKWELAANYSATREQNDSGNQTTTSRLFVYQGTYDYFFSADKDLYGYAKASKRTNKPDGLDSRLDAGVGLGYRFDLYLDAQANVEVGASYVIDEKVNTATERAPVFRGAYDLDTPLSEDVSLTNVGEFLNGDNIETYQHALGLRWTMNDTMYLQFAYTLLWDNFPAPGSVTTDRIWVLVLGASF